MQKVVTSIEHKQQSRAAQGYDYRSFVELHARSTYSFLRGASSPAQFVQRARELGMDYLGMLDRDGFYGAVQFSQAAAQHGIRTVFGAELTLHSGVLAVLCKGPAGYKALSHLITQGQMEHYPPLEEIAEQLAGLVYVLADAESNIAQLVEAFGADAVLVELHAGMCPGDVDTHARQLEGAQQFGLRVVCSAIPAAATVHNARLAAAKQSLQQRESVMEHEPNLPPMGATWLRDGVTLLRAYPDLAEALATTRDIAQECAFNLELVAPNLPRYPVPAGHTLNSWLRHLTFERAERRYAKRTADIRQRAFAQIEHELAVIEQLDFPGYFLIVLDIVDFCVRENILCQGRGSAANSTVCFSLGITNAEPISNGLLFERFLSPERDGPPDIDIDIESTRREEVIQYVYRTYGRDRAAQVANVITYRRKGALRDAARALGLEPDAASAANDQVQHLAEQFLDQPRHLGIHSGGMVICDRPIADVVPIQWATKENRSVVQWDKEDCAAAGLVKFDLLGLGMLEALHHCLDLVPGVDLWELDCADPAVYDMLSAADAVGVFQVESRAQMAALPRLRPRCFFDLVVQVALVRPGPIQGGSVHPYIRRRNGEEEITYEHPCLEPALAKTLGVPLFQEQLMQIAKDAAGFSGAEADTLRRAMGAKRSVAKMEALHTRFVEGTARLHGMPAAVAESLWQKMIAFAAYGFPESHSQSFASLVYFSAWFKCYYPAEFCVALLRAQPMGFYSPQSLIADARRHHITIRPIGVDVSGVQADVVDGEIQLGFDLVKGLGAKAAARLVDARSERPFASIADVARRADLNVAQTEALARAGAFDCFGLSRREALWAAGVAATEKASMLPELSQLESPSLPGMNAFELLAAEIASTGVTHATQPMALLREQLAQRGIVRACDLFVPEDGTRIEIAGVVTHRQRPSTAGGITFLGVEDETGLYNVLVSPGCWQAYEAVARRARALIVRGIVQNASGAATIVADRLEPLPVAELLHTGSRDFH